MPDSLALRDLAELGSKYAKELAIQEELEKAIAESKAITTRLQDVTIPDLMSNLGLEEFKLKTGEMVKLKPVFGASVAEVRKPEAWAWLRNNGYGSLIKVTLGCKFGMGEEDLSFKAEEALKANGIPYTCKEDVHASTLKSFVTEQYEEGKTFPEALFGAFTKTIAQIKSNKK